MNVTVSVDTRGLDKLLHDFPAALARAQQRALRAIGAHVASEATRAFRDASLRPSPWKPRKKTKHDDGHQLLIRTGALRQSIRWRVTAPDTVEVFTPTPYAKYHQAGTKKMPARPFMPVDKQGNLTPRMQRKINADVEKAFREELSKLGVGSAG